MSVRNVMLDGVQDALRKVGNEIAAQLQSESDRAIVRAVIDAEVDRHEQWREHD